MLDGLNTSSTLPTPTNKASVVSRDSVGNFSANLITATVTNANALNGANSTGFISRIGSDIHASRTITGSGSDISVANGDGISANPTISAGSNLARRNATNTYTLTQNFTLITANALLNDGNSNLFTGLNNLSPTSTNGFVYVPMISGEPTGTPTLNNGRSPVVWDSTNNKLWIYSADVWNSVSGGIPDASITPVKLSTGAPSWDVNGNVSITGNANLGNAVTDVTTIAGAVSLNGSVGTTGQVPSSRGANLPPIWANPASGFSNMQVFTASGTFTVPAGITKAKITVVGGGGSGGLGGTGAFFNQGTSTVPTNGGAGGAGGAGGYAVGIFTLIPGTNISVTVGVGGTSSFSTLISATAGGAGAAGGNATNGSASNGVNGANGGGGTGGGGQLNYTGGIGSGNVRGGDSIFSGGGGNVSTNAILNSGGGGTGGTGGIGSTNIGRTGGGSGSAGVVIIEY